ncbi:MAG TPA: adenylate/guanylate cyclase domain-containing protein [Acidimicrobiales bacterium]|nr:adenylate/guanylate cyclase domain-containing protein [Acidimicrobiales bacterium]
MTEIRYARAGETHVAFRTLGEAGGTDVVMVAAALFPFEMLAEDRVASRFTEGLTALGRLVVFDKRGVGLSDPVTDWSRSLQDQWAEDLLAVIDDAGLERPVVVSWEQHGVARFAAAARPGTFSSMVLINPSQTTAGFVRDLQRQSGQMLPNRSIEEMAFPSRIDDEGFTSWLSRSGRSGASPSTASRIWAHLLGFTSSLTPPGISTPTLLLHNRDCRQSEAEVRAVAEHLAHATFVQVAGRDVYPIAGEVDTLTAEIAEFVTGVRVELAPERCIAAVLFTDLVDSTQRAADAGDAHWRDLLDVHDHAVQRCVRHHGGRIVKYTGDGVLALLPSAAGALETARSIIEGLTEQGLQVRVGIHVGDVDVRGDDVSGLAVNVAARVMASAKAGETLASEAARQATLGTGQRFEEVGATRLKGLPGEWRLFRWVP